jgi:spore coat polysaccharide biosynthesis protein SpsF
MYKCLITVRSASTRLKKKCLLKLGKYSIIEHILQRSKKFKLIPIICTTNLPKDKIFKNIANKYKVKIFFGSEKNKLKRWYDCAKKFKLNTFHTIDADDPYFDHKNIIKSLKSLDQYDIIKPSVDSREGSASEGYSFKTSILGKLLVKENLMLENKNTEMIDKIIEKNKVNFKICQLANCKYLTKNKFRLTVDYKEDYQLIRKLYSVFGSFETRQKINCFLDKNSSLRNINYFRNNQWKKRQNSLIMKQK